MPVSLAQMAANTASVTFQVDSDSCTVVYFPAKITTDVLTRLNTSYEERNAALPEILKSWDVYEDADMANLLPIDEASLKALGVPFGILLVRAISDDMRPN